MNLKEQEFHILVLSDFVVVDMRLKVYFTIVGTRFGTHIE